MCCIALPTPAHWLAADVQAAAATEVLLLLLLQVDKGIHRSYSSVAERTTGLRAVSVEFPARMEKVAHAGRQ